MKQLSMKLRISGLLILLSVLTGTAFGQGSVYQTTQYYPICTGYNASFAYSGSCGSIFWQIEGGGTIISSTSTTVTVRWNSPTTSAAVVARCNSNQSLTVGTGYFTVSGSITPSVSISGPTSICVGTNATYQAAPTNGGSSPTYNWRINGVSQQVATNSTFVTTQLNQGDVVTVQMTSNAGCVSSPTVTSNGITISTATQPSPVSVGISGPSSYCYGQSSGAIATYSASSSNGGSSPVYVWYRNGAEVTDNELSGSQYRPHYALNHGDKITCRLTSNASCVSGNPAISNEITVSIVSETPTLWITASKTSFCMGDQVTFTANSNFPLSYFQWSIDNSVALSTASSFTTSDLSSGHVVYLSAAATTSCGSVSVNANTQNMLTVYPALVASISPAGTTKICSTCSQVLTATTGTDYFYQWTRNSVNIPGTNSPTYTATEAGNYAVVVTRSTCTSKVSNVSTISLNAKPLVNAGADQTFTAPVSSITLTGSASDPDGTIAAYLWSKVSGKNVMISNSNTPSATISGLLIGEYIFRLSATDDFGETTSDDVKITVVAPDNNYNYIRETTLREAQSSESALDGLTVMQKSVATTYYDGLGRPMQKVGWQASPDQHDVVQPLVYDEYGRQQYHYLPVVPDETDGFYKPNEDIIDQTTHAYKGIVADFYQPGSNNNIADDSRPYGETLYEASPLNRQERYYGAGQDWIDHDKYVAEQYLANIDGTGSGQEQIIAWTLDASGLVVRNLISTLNNGTGYYPTGTLFIKSTKDEQGNEIREYTNKEGRLILKKVQAEATVTSLNNTHQWAQTYYVYDDLGNLRFVLQPELIKTLAANAVANPTVAQLEQFVFQYRYDQRRRMIEKKIPGADPLYMVYDDRDRLVMTQDGNQRRDAAGSITKTEWGFTKYDALNRPVITGIYTHTSVVDQAAMATLISTTHLFESYNGNAATHGYTNNVFPTVGTKALSVTYYDDYRFRDDMAGASSYGYTANELTGQEAAESTNVIGHVTGSKINVLETNDYLWSVTYYDGKYRVLQVKSQNHKGGVDRVTNRYDFVQLKETKTVHAPLQGTYTVQKKFEYDHAGRLVDYFHKLQNEPNFVFLQKNEYSKLGQLVTKRLHSRDNGNTFLQKIDYGYTIRGWLEKLNNPDSPEPNDLFSMELNYNAPTANGGVAQYNGNISEMVWNSAGYGGQSYGYTYDAMNRLSEAKYYNKAKPSENGRYTEKIGAPTGTDSGYDLNGNILKLTRYGRINSFSHGLMDNLIFTYAGNQLTRVDDAVPTNAQEEGFRENAKVVAEYIYDFNGNMSKDENKGLISITSNLLNLPMQVNKSASEYLVYSYDAMGRKLSQQVIGTAAKTTDYIGDFVYENNILQFIHHGEGRIVMTGTTPEYQYFLKDHLGNVRLTVSEKTTATPYKATFEMDTQANEQATFEGYANRNGFNLYDHTDSGTGSTYSQLLNGGNNGQVGLAKSFSVNAGDVLDLEVFAKYEEAGSTGNNPNALLNSLIAVFGLSSTGTTALDGPQAFNAFNSAFSPGPYIGRISVYEDDTAPRAYLNYILFDENFAIVDFGFDQISAAAKQVGVAPIVPHDLLSLHVKVKQRGYLYVYLSNEQSVQTNVYFDDLEIVHYTAVESSNDYYPFGLTYNSYSYTNTVKQDYRYNGKEFQDELGIGWLDYGARMYMPDIGRWGVLDAKAERGYGITPYNYSVNNPVVFVDPDGKWTVSRHYEMTLDALTKYSNMSKGQARLLAKYASMFADNPGGHTLLNNLVHPFNAMAYNGWETFSGKWIDYSVTKNSQVTDWNPSIGHENYNIWHSMRSPWEREHNSISESQAMLRGMAFGWSKIFSSAKKNSLKNLNVKSDGIEEWGQGLHALQDAYAHKGVDIDNHDVINDRFGDTSEAKVVTNSAIMVHSVMSGDTETFNSMLKEGNTSLDLQGMSGDDLVDLATRIGENGKQLSYNWETKKYDIK
jgi:RHS repeat-associated protein